MLRWFSFESIIFELEAGTEARPTDPILYV
jgi:hypothetical protein